MKHAAIFGVSVLCLFAAACGPKETREIHIGFIGPLSGNAVDLGEGPARAMQLAVVEYNERRAKTDPLVYFHIRDDLWVGENAVPLYDELRAEHDIEILLISHSDGTMALQDKVAADDVVLINALNNDAMLAGMNANTFTVGKKTEEAAQVVAGRVLELGKTKVGGFYVTNSFMTISANAFAEHLLKKGIEVELTPVEIGKEDYSGELERFKNSGCDALAFFGYKNLGYAMKMARDLGMDVPFFASTTTLGAGYYENSEGAMDGTEFSFFTASDGNDVIASQFLDRYRLKYGSNPFSVWPAMQAYDAMGIITGIIEKDADRPQSTPFADHFKNEMLKVNHFEGVCGNLAILSDGTSRGIYFSLYEVKGNGVMEKVRR